MRIKVRLVVLVGLVASMLLLSGCFLNSVFQTAQTVGKGNVLVSVGMGAQNLSQQPGKYNWAFTPQVGVHVGLTDNVDFGIRGEFGFGSTGKPEFLGAVGDLKAALIQDPTSFSFAVGISSGYSPKFWLYGWLVEGLIYLDSNINFLPIYLIYRPGFYIGGADAFKMVQQLAGGLHLNLSNNVRLLVEADWVDWWPGLLSVGIALDVRF